MEVHCEYFFDGFSYKCYIARQNFSNNSRIKSFNGHHQAAHNNANVSVVIFEECEMFEFPKNLHTFFPHLTIIQVIDCPVKEISREDLRNYPGLLYLGVIGTNIEYLPGDLFHYTPKLEIVDFSRNRIKQIGGLLLEPLVQVKAVNFRGNESINHEWILNDKHKEANVKTIDEMTEIIKLKAKPVESLKHLAGSTVIKNIKDEEMALKVLVLGHRYDLGGVMRRAFIYLKRKGEPWMIEKDYHYPSELIKVIYGYYDDGV